MVHVYIHAYMQTQCARAYTHKHTHTHTHTHTHKGDERAKADARREKKRIQEQQRRRKKKQQKQGVDLDDDYFADAAFRPREKAGTITITKEVMQLHQKEKKRRAGALPDHLQGKAFRGGRAGKRRRLDPLNDLKLLLERGRNAMWQDTRSIPFRTPVDVRSNPQVHKDAIRVGVPEPSQR